MEEIIATKFDPPVWMGEQIRRNALLTRLNGALHHRLTLIQAPAGYGKTSLLSQWRQSLANQPVQVAWLTLEQDDRDLKRLIDYLTVAVGAPAPPSEALPPRAALSAIVNLLGAARRQFVLVLDDLHQARGDEVAEFLRLLIRRAPVHCHFVIASRDYPSLGQSVLAAEEQLLEIGPEDLRFTASETELVLGRADRGLCSGDVDRILERTEGWPIAVQLTSLSLKRGGDHEQVIGGLSSAGSDLARYLSEQVLLTLSEDVRDIVVRTSILNELCGDTVNLLCDRHDGWLLLERLEQQGIFLVSANAEKREYRYHQLFAEFMRSRLERSDPLLFASLHEKLAVWFAGRSSVASAVSHAIRSGSSDTLARIVEEAGGWQLIPQGKQGVVERALEAIPQSIIDMRPPLALAQVYLKIKQGKLGLARADFDRLEQTTRTSQLSPELRTDMAVVGDTLGDYENLPISLDDLVGRESLIRQMPTTDHLIVANSSETLAAKYFEGGWLERALQPTLAAREHYLAMGSVYSDLFTRFLESRIKRAQGLTREAAAILGAAAATIVENFGEHSDLAANCAAFRAEILYEEDRVEEAQAMLDWAIPHMEHSDGWVDVYAAAYLTQARAHAGSGAMDEAMQTLDRARRLSSRRGLRQLELLTDLCEIELLLGFSPDLPAARQKAEALGLDALADAFSDTAPVYRPVVVAAALCRAKLRLRERDVAGAMEDLRALEGWARLRGAGRLLLDLNIIQAFALRESGDPDAARREFDDAIGMAMFQGLVRPFVDNRRFLAQAFEERHATVDRYRDQFIKTVAKAVAASRGQTGCPNLLSEAETQVLFYLSQGHSNKEIARQIGMSPDTVKFRLKSVFRKIGVHKRRDAARVSAERGLFGELSALASVANAGDRKSA